jgi:polysaccharide export outer membrane protein
VPTDTSSLPATYRLQPYDVLRVKFLYHPELDAKVPVGPDGSLNVVGVGEFRAAGKTPEELAREIERRSSDHLRDPKVDVVVAELGKYKVWVFGEVRSPGEVQYREGMTPLQAIGDRGGFTDYGRADSVIRVTRDGAATRIDLSGNPGNPQALVMGENDIIYVPRTFVGDAVAFMRTVRNLLPIQPRLGFGYSLD